MQKRILKPLSMIQWAHLRCAKKLKKIKRTNRPRMTSRYHITSLTVHFMERRRCRINGNRATYFFSLHSRSYVWNSWNGWNLSKFYRASSQTLLPKFETTSPHIRFRSIETKSSYLYNFLYQQIIYSNLERYNNWTGHYYRDNVKIPTRSTLWYSIALKIPTVLVSNSLGEKLKNLLQESFHWMQEIIYFMVRSSWSVGSDPVMY